MINKATPWRSTALLTLLLVLLPGFRPVEDPEYISQTISPMREPLSQVQEPRVTLDLKGASMGAFFDELKKQTGYDFVYSSDLFKDGDIVTVSVTNVSLSKVLEGVLAKKGLSYSISGKIVTIKEVKIGDAEPKRRLTGTVIDDTGLPLYGATVYVEKYNLFTLTDSDGKYSLEVPAGEALDVRVSMTGINEVHKTIPAGEKDFKLDATLVSEVELDEVVVTGFVAKSKASFTGSETTVSQKELLSVGTKNLFQSLSAFVPGMEIVTNNLSGADPNARPEINIRGRSSFEGAANIPIFIVDGAQMTLDYIYDMDMHDVESVTVLKDASATALYGAKGSAGVVVIKTKALPGGKLRFSYSGTARFGIPDLTEYHLLNAADKLEYERLAGLYDSDDGKVRYTLDESYRNRLTLVARGVNTDWLVKPLRVGVSQNHNLSVSGGDDYARYSVGLRYNKDEGVMKGSYRERLSGNFRLSYNTDRRLFLSNMTAVNYVRTQESPYGSFSSYTILNPYDTPYDENGDLRPVLSYNMTNPLYEASLGSYANGDNLNVLNNTELQFWVGEDWRFDGSFAINITKFGNRLFVSPLSKNELLKVSDIFQRGKLNEGAGKSLNYSGKLMASYNKYILEKLFLSATVGANIDAQNSDDATYRTIGYFSEKLAHPAFGSGYPVGEGPTGSETITNNVGFFINANTIYDDRYFLDLIFRYEGSSQFGKNKRFSPFWSVGAGWNIHNEEWMKGSGFNTLKLRASTGYTGNVSFSPFQALTTLSYGNGLNYGKGIGAIPITIGNPDLQWERTLNVNVGLDVTLFDGRWDMTLDGYVKNTDNLLLDVTKAPSIGVTTAKENIGSIINTGVELSTRVVPIRTNDWQWSLSLNGAYNRNRIVKISEALKRRNEENLKSEGQLAPLPIYEEGGSLNDLKVVPSAGIDPATGKEIYIKPDGTYTFNYDDRYKQTFGVTTPLALGSFSSYLIYKGFSLNILFSYTLGAVAYNTTLASRVEGNDPRQNADQRVFEDRWRTPGQPALYKDIADSSVPRQTSRFVQTNNTLELRTVSLAYEFERDIIQHIGLNQMRLEILTNNLFYLSTVRQERGLSYPFERSFEFSMRFSF